MYKNNERISGGIPLKYVIDSAFFLSGLDPSALEGECFITPEIRGEVKKGFSARRMAYFMDSGALKMASPGKDWVKRVMEKAEEIGEVRRLSEADVSILALAMELSATIITDDYSVQNMARILGISYLTVNERGIEKVWTWKYRCTGCGRFFSESYERCPICGSQIKTTALDGRK